MFSFYMIVQTCSEKKQNKKKTKMDILSTVTVLFIYLFFFDEDKSRLLTKVNPFDALF